MKRALIALLIGAALFFVGYKGLKSKPRESSLSNPGAKAPIQADIPAGSAEAAPIMTSYDGTNFRLHPKAKYTLEGLIVSQHRSDSVWDHVHTLWGDLLNSRDLCTVWGQTLASGIFRDVDFWSGQWTCYYRYWDEITAGGFKPHEVSNTHVLASDPVIRKAIDELEIGDEYRMRGLLVDYEIVGDAKRAGFRRNTSLIRTDTDNGACEILLVQSVELIKSHNRVFRQMRDLGQAVFLLSLAAIVGIMIKAIFFARR